VVPRSWGITRPPLFFITDHLKRCKKKTNEEVVPLTKFSSESSDPNISIEAGRAVDENQNYLLRCVGLTKAFTKGRTVLDDFSLALSQEECFGLLGPNGAGKTTLISILSGTIQATAGYAVVDGETTTGNNPRVRDVIGICPQFDILWDDLTVTEHLNYYLRLKGLTKGQKLHVLVSELTDKVGLQDHLTKRASGLSGGMKRKLSIAISLVGNPKLLLLDEPTTGLDPEARRDVWDIIQDAQAGRCTVITTHNMEEADVLCTRIGIVTRGKLRCLGNQQYLKTRFGSGFNFTLTAASVEVVPQVEAFVSKFFPNAVLDTKYSTSLSYLVPGSDVNLSHLFTFMRVNKDQLGKWPYHEYLISFLFII
jgi:ABC-type multidrug transport system ATPase subunit